MPEKAHVVIYTKPGCHLCDEAKAEIRAAGCADFFSLEEVNIESNAELKELYGQKIPVITINGTEAFRYRVSPEKFRDKIKGL